jgi:hypothetical protein
VRPARSRLVLFSAAIAVLAAVLAVIWPAGIASSATSPAAETRVWAFSSAAHDHIKADQPVSAVQRLGEVASCPFCVSGACVAPEDEGGAGGGLTRVGRWMSRTEYDHMVNSGRVVEGAGGRTYVISPPDPASYPGAAPGSVYSEFNVPSDVLQPASKLDWWQIPGPNIATTRFGPPPTEMPPATCIELVCAK